MGSVVPKDAPIFNWDTEMYKDTGCQVAPKCLTCPLVQCIYDDPQPWMAAKRWRMKKLESEGKTRVEIAAATGSSLRSVYRIIKNA
jgi:hypothetical protein